MVSRVTRKCQTEYRGTPLRQMRGSLWIHLEKTRSNYSCRLRSSINLKVSVSAIEAHLTAKSSQLRIRLRCSNELQSRAYRLGNVRAACPLSLGQQFRRDFNSNLTRSLHMPR